MATKPEFLVFLSPSSVPVLVPYLDTSRSGGLLGGERAMIEPESVRCPYSVEVVGVGF